MTSKWQVGGAQASGRRRVFAATYRGYVDDGPDAVRAFTFRTAVRPGVGDPD